MFSILICAMLGQPKAGDSVYVKPPGAQAWKTASMAAIRYREAVYSGSFTDRPIVSGTPSTWRFDKRTKLSVLAVEDYDGEKLVRVKAPGNQTWWMIAADLSVLDDAGQATFQREEMADRLRKYCVTKPDHAALAAAIGKGIDPLTMTSEQAATLTASQRKAISGIKARYARAKK